MTEHEHATTKKQFVDSMYEEGEDGTMQLKCVPVPAIVMGSPHLDSDAVVLYMIMLLHHYYGKRTKAGRIVPNQRGLMIAWR